VCTQYAAEVWEVMAGREGPGQPFLPLQSHNEEEHPGHLSGPGILIHAEERAQAAETLFQARTRAGNPLFPCPFLRKSFPLQVLEVLEGEEQEMA
jgi:hypothetical protein